MSFASLAFAAFIVVVLPLFHALPRGLRLPFLVAASFLFYAWGDWRHCVLLLVTSLSAFLVGQAMARAADAASRRTWLLLGLVINLGMLGFFKYAGFLMQSAAALAGFAGLELQPPAFGIALPIGISFFVFQAVGYLVDVYRRVIPAEPSAVRLAALLSMFPHLVAGPILRAPRLLPQLHALPPVTLAQAARGVELIAWGYFLKLCLADNAAPLVARRFADPTSFGAADHAVAALLFAFQIYGDFAGYSLIAIGLGLLLGFDFGPNFDRPYFSASISEFWRRWHISLSSWLRDYLYIPLGGSRHGAVMTARNLLLTMLFGGLWHGAAWTFVLWGAWHGLLLALERLLAHVLGPLADGSPWRRLRPLRIGLTFLLVCIGWILFRAESLADAGEIFGRLLRLASSEGFAGAEQMHLWRTVAAIAITLAVDAAAGSPRISGLYLRSIPARMLGAACLVWLILLIGRFEGTEFIYFQF
jgi:D-alanyl-lipoteichoic acid acyltransferase DltB (MBOAT superfamily)